jgi:hypothetical protein
MLAFADKHELAPGQAVTFGGEMRFVSSIVSEWIVELNAPFSVTPTDGAPIGPTLTYRPAEDVATVSLFDYWGPEGAVNRILNGAAVNRMRVKVNGDYHEFEFEGTARDLLDSTSFAPGQGELLEFPVEPAAALFDYTIIPGHLGQAWLGNAPDRFYTVTAAELLVDNDIQTRSREFGTDAPRCLSAGQRKVTVDFSVMEMNDDATKGLYQAARQLSPISVMFQLGQQPGQLFGACLNAVVPEVPEFNDGDTRLEWRFSSCRAQGTADDEIVIAFG